MLSSVKEVLVADLKRQDLLNVNLQGVRRPLERFSNVHIVKLSLLYYIVEEVTVILELQILRLK